MAIMLFFSITNLQLIQDQHTIFNFQLNRHIQKNLPHHSLTTSII